MGQSVELLGPLRVLAESTPVRLGGAKERGLLALLALRTGRVVPLGVLVDGLWGEEPPSTALNTLQVYVSHLRRVLGREVIATDSAGYRLALDPERVDAVRFERLVGAGRAALERSEPERAGQLLEAALDLWRGEPLAGCGGAPGLAAEAVRLAELRLVAVEDRFAAELECGRHAELVPALRGLVEEHPFREQLRVALLLALYRAGRTAEALAAFEETRQLWARELGLDPSPKLQRLHLAILGEDSSVRAPAAEARRWRPPPAAANPIVGRAQELAAVRGLLIDPGVRLVTVLGPGGVGKTRLAVEVADVAGQDFADGVCWVGLAAVRDPDHVLSAIAQGLGVRHPDGEDLVERVCAVLRRRRLLLVIDNAEHLPGVPAVVADLIAGAPEVTVLATSRTALRLAAEHRHLIHPLPVPAVSAVEEVLRAPAAELFWARACAVEPALTLTAANAVAVAGLCVRLEGLPLAIELAAARVNVLSPVALHSRLDRRLSLLTSGVRDADHRHQSLRATLAWSHDLLGPAERELFARLAVFRGGWTLEAAEAVAEGTQLDVLDGLSVLVDASLITRTPQDDETRFGMLETIREYAAEQLAASGGETAVRESHARYYANLVSAGWPSIPRAPRTAADVRRLDVEQENLRAALGWTAIAGRDDLLADLACAVAPRWLRIGLVAEVDGWLGRVIANPPSRARHIDALYWRWLVPWMAGDTATCVRWSREAVELARSDPPRLALCLASLAATLGATGDVEEAVPTGDAAVELARRVCDPTTLASVLGDVACGLDTRPERAKALLDEAGAAAAAVGDELTLASVAGNLGEIAIGLGDADTAQRSAETALRLPISVADPFSQVYPLDTLGGAMLLKGDLPRAEILLGEALRLSEQLHDGSVLPEVALKLAALAASRGHYRRAAVLHAAYTASLRRRDLSPPGSSRYLAERFLADLDQRLPAEELAAARAEGNDLSHADLFRYAASGRTAPLATTAP